MSIPNENERYLNKQQLAARYGVKPRAIDRWIADPKLKFPPAYDFAGRPYRKLSDIEAWERARAAIPASARAPRGIGARKQAGARKRVAATSEPPEAA
jgi:predicted DNA-binding transcriptional regulator AlpA